MEINQLHKLFIGSEGICTDSRSIKSNQIFFALSGQNFNGNQFADKAISQGAAYAVIDDPAFQTDTKSILVPDVLKCLQELGNFHRKYLGTPIIAITGTNGKTTTKELISSVLQKKYNIAFTQGNLNNHIGVPLTLLSLNKNTEIGVVEMGANHPDEISALCKIALPDYGIINNIGKAHLEGFGSFEGVIKAKSELYQYCKANQKNVFVNGNDPLLMELSCDLERILYGSSNNLDYYAQFIASNPYLEIRWNNKNILTQLVGEYNFNNVLAAIAVGSYFKVPEQEIISAIEQYSPRNNRSQLTKTSNNTLIIDAYNANPSSMDLAIRNFVNIKNPDKLLIIGDMFELGEVAYEEHQKIFQLISNLDFEQVYLVGQQFSQFKMSDLKNFQFFLSTKELSDYLSINQISGKTILLKASRGIGLERIIGYL